MNIIKQKWEFLNSLMEVVPAQRSKLFRFGTQVLALRSIESLRSNARLLPFHAYTAKSKIYRLTSNAKIPFIFVCILRTLDVVGIRDTIVVDFSDFGNGFHVLLFAKQTRRGRTIPLYFDIIRYPIDKGSQNIFIINLHFPC
jgi:hypothetical protein